MSRFFERDIDVKDAREAMMKGRIVFCQDESGMILEVSMICKSGEAFAGGDLFIPVRYFVTEIA